MNFQIKRQKNQENPQNQEINLNQEEDDVQTQNAGKWTKDQNIKYAIFLDYNKSKLSSRQKRKQFRMFEHLSLYLGSRTTVQCRSHHQKLEERFKTIKLIISSIKLQIGKENYRRIMKEQKKKLKFMRIDQNQTHREDASSGCQTNISWVHLYHDLTASSSNPFIFPNPSFFMPMYASPY